MANSVKISNGALDQAGDDIVLRGVISPDSLILLHSDDYQREILSGASFEGLCKALKTGSVPDVILGMRGQRTSERDGHFYLQDPVYIVDGLQRITAAKHVMASSPDIEPRLGATIHFGTNEEWERNQFIILNSERVKVSPNVLARNMRHSSPPIATLFSMTESERDFVLFDRVCWSQRMRRNDVLTATAFLKVIGRLHSHLGPGRSNRIPELASSLKITMERIGRNTFRENVRQFFALVDQCWGIRNVAFKGAVHLRYGFLSSLTRLFSTHNRYFFKDRVFFVDADTKRKLKQFPINDPQVGNLASSSGQGEHILYMMLVDHVNRGRRTRRLIEPDLEMAMTNGDQADAIDEEAVESGETVDS